MEALVVSASCKHTEEKHDVQVVIANTVYLFSVFIYFSMSHMYFWHNTIVTKNATINNTGMRMED
jgi:hypothetical protein